jgi:rhodanese-related sulfurtransferase
MFKTLSAQAAKTQIHGPQECALLDIREHGQYGEGHPFLSVHCPYSDIEQSVCKLVPNTQVPVILMDDGDGVAERAAARLQAMGYVDVAILQGGAPAWEQAGYTLFKGVNLPSKTLGELVEHVDRPQRLTAQQLHDWQQAGRAFHFFDTRPPNEYAKMTIPGARCVPNGELAHRLAAVVPNATDPIVLTCAGRTRGLIGAAGLGRLGLRNPIYAVENGTQGWALAGFNLQRGNGLAAMPALTPEQIQASRTRAEALIAAEHLSVIDVPAFLALAQSGQRTVYLVDVRSVDEYAQGHLPGAEQAWSGQVAQAADLNMGVRRAQVVLSDDTGMRAALAAVWLRALGYEPFILRETAPDALPADWRIHAPVLPEAPTLPPVAAADVAQALRAERLALVDVRASQDFRKRHVQSARWASRARLASQLQDLPVACAVVLVADDAVAAAYTAQDLRALGYGVKGQLAGGPPDWEAAGLPLLATPDAPSDADCIDFLFFVHDRHDGNLESARRYLAWETGLMAQLDAAERNSFRLVH